MMTRTISEAASKKRGRPRKLPREIVESWTAVAQWGGKTSRYKAEAFYWLKAAEALTDGEQFNPRFRWLVDNNNGWSRKTLLAELGRVERPDVIRLLAEDLCRDKPKVKDAIARLRRFRLTVNLATLTNDDERPE